MNNVASMQSANFMRLEFNHISQWMYCVRVKNTKTEIPKWKPRKYVNLFFSHIYFFFAFVDEKITSMSNQFSSVGPLFDHQQSFLVSFTAEFSVLGLFMDK